MYKRQGYGGDGNIAVVGIQGDQGKTSASYVTVTSSEGASDSVAAEASDEQSAWNDVVAENTSDWSVQNSEGSESTDSAEAESSNAAVAGTSSQDQKEENRRAADEAHEMPVSYTHLDVYKRQPTASPDCRCCSTPSAPMVCLAYIPWKDWKYSIHSAPTPTCSAFSCSEPGFTQPRPFAAASPDSASSASCHPF